ncbi:hypothetical protein E1264_15375 [Actinomadura sp. KC216]|uniref:hypothetical protein n=1 Tax=Actinomadura sp. KC216 TaxID=2530370 RepID=UPI001053CED9|nr:hypothetical protein [Actinomadura sp. KC216]TDB87236.1 hypothetical protein E1264_15375 [Actinomadura sp. KC216]
MALSITVADSLDDITDDEFFELDGSLGAMGSRVRLQQHSQDPRWSARYVIAREGNAVRAVLPLFLGHGDQWSDRLNSPRTWGYDGDLRQATSALIGGRLEIRGSMRCADDPAVLQAVADRCADMEELRGRDLFFGFFDSRQAELAEAVFGSVKWLDASEDFVYPEPVVLGDPANLPRSVRQLIRQDERRIEEFGITASVIPWPEYDGVACDLIADHNRRKGMDDHALLAEYRMDQWTECPGVSAYVVHAEMADVVGVTTLLHYRDELEVYEIGLPEGDGRARRTLYSCLTFNEPRRFARDNGIGVVRAGPDAALPKRIRGAEPIIRHSGYLRSYCG